MTVGHANVKVKKFRGVEALLEPDMRRLTLRYLLNVFYSIVLNWEKCSGYSHLVRMFVEQSRHLLHSLLHVKDFLYSHISKQSLVVDAAFVFNCSHIFWTRSHFCVNKYPPAGYMAGSSATTKGFAATVVQLRRDRYLDWLLLHPENENIHPSRSMIDLCLECFALCSMWIPVSKWA